MSDPQIGHEAAIPKNYFLQQFLSTFAEASPEIRVRDPEQPSTGSLKREDIVRPYHCEVGCFKAKSEIVLKCKELGNEELLPASSSEVDLSRISTNSLMLKRRSRLARLASSNA